MTPAGPSLWTLLEPLTWVLLHFVWQGLLVAAALAVLLWLTQRATPWTRYRIACWSLLVMVCLPLVTLTVLLGNHGPTTEIQSTLVGTEASAGASLDVVPNAVASLIERPSTWLGTRQSLEVLRWSLFAVWLIGVAAQSASHTFGWTQLRRLARIGCRPAPSNWQRLVDQLAHRLGLGVAVKVLQSTAIEVPTVIGWLRPVVLLPISSLTGLNAQQLEAVLAHELAHIWRRDYLVNLLQVCAETILFYHPAVWWVSRQIREEREHCCDDAAVALTGDRMALAKALLKLEELRGTTPHLAPAASGGSLVQRISRLLGGKAVSHHQTRHPLLNAVFIVSILAVVGVAWAAVATHPPNAGLLAASNTELLAPNVAGGAGIHDSDTIHGTWEADHKFGRDRIRLNVIGEHGKSNMNIRIGSADFSALAGGSTELRREAGTIRFEGNPGVGSGSGRFTFQPNWQFLEQLKRYDIDGYGSHEMFVLATMDIDLDYVSEIDRLGYGEELDGDTLIAIGIHGVSPDYIRGITSRGYENTELDEFLAMRIHGVTVDEIDEIRALGYELDADEMLAWRIHGVDREFIESIEAAGFQDLSGDDLVAMRIHGVSGDWIGDIHELGMTSIDAETALAFRIHGVSAEFLQGFEDLGYSNLNAEDLLSMRIHNVGTRFVDQLADLGYTGVLIDELVAMKIHNVDARFIKKQLERYGSGISIDDMIENKILDRY